MLKLLHALQCCYANTCNNKLACDAPSIDAGTAAGLSTAVAARRVHSTTTTHSCRKQAEHKATRKPTACILCFNRHTDRSCLQSIVLPQDSAEAAGAEATCTLLLGIRHQGSAALHSRISSSSGKQARNTLLLPEKHSSTAQTRNTKLLRGAYINNEQAAPTERRAIQSQH
jgi:hypothetical protein